MGKLKTILAPVLLFVLIMGLVHCRVLWHLEGEREALRREIESLCLRKSADLGDKFSRLLTAPGIVASMIYAGAVDTSSFEVVARAVRAAFPGLESMSLAPGGVISSIDPRAGREHLLGMDFLSDPIRAFGSAEAVRTGRGAVTGPYILASGKQGFLGKVPAFTPGDPDNRFWGFVASAMSLDALVDASGLGDLPRSGFAYRLEKRGGREGRMETIAGSAAPLYLAVSSDLDVSGVKLRLTIGAAAPPPGPGSSMGDYLEGAALALALCVLLYLRLRGAVSGRAAPVGMQAAPAASGPAACAAPDRPENSAPALPSESPEMAPAAAPLPHPGSGLAAPGMLEELARGMSGKRVLVAARSAADRDAVGRMLGAAGILADLAGSGHEAVGLVARSQYDAVLVDLSLPGLDEALAGMPRDEAGEGLPVLALGGEGAIDDRIRALEYGMEEHLPLPLDAASLLAALRPHLAGRVPGGGQRPPALDKERALALLLGNAGLYARLLSGFASEYAQAGRHMRDLVTGGKAREGAILAHSIKGLAANLGGGRLHAAALDLEGALGAGQTPPRAMLDGFEAALDEFLTLAVRTAAELAENANQPE